MKKQSGKAQSHLLTIRIWQEEIEASTMEWRGKVQLVTSGEVSYFHGWTRLVPLLQTLLAQVEPVEAGDEWEINEAPAFR